MVKTKKSSRTVAPTERRRRRRAMVKIQSRPPQRDGDRGGTADGEPPKEEPARVKILTKKQVLARVPMSYPTLWAMMKRGEFPRSRQMSEERIGWIEDEINSWILNLPVRALSGDERSKEAS